MNKKLWIPIIVLVIITMAVAYFYLVVVPRFDDSENIQATVLNQIKNGNEVSYCKVSCCDRCALFSGCMGGSGITGEIEVQSDIYIDNSFEIDKIELQLAMENDYIQYKDNYEEYIVKTIDITDEVISYDEPFISGFQKHSFDVKTTLTEENGFDINRGMYYAVVVTFSDGYQGVVFPFG